MLKENKGMTLVALVIAIVVLLALAATVIYLVFGKNGVATENKTLVEVQDKNYAESVVNVGLKAVKLQDLDYSEDETMPQTYTNSEKMDLLISLLDRGEFSKESDTVLVYTNNYNLYRITVDFDDYIIKNIK